jgi:3-hydroxybutyryl-CoA dehydrogenase
MTLKEIFVVGSGLMGSGIAQVFAQVGMGVTLNDENIDALQKAQKTIAWSVGKFVEKGRLNEDAATIMDRIQFGAGTAFLQSGALDAGRRGS